jgi:hypothetical protein
VRLEFVRVLSKVVQAPRCFSNLPGEAGFFGKLPTHSGNGREMVSQ